MKFNYLSLLIIILVSCSKVEPRRPINKKKTSSEYNYSISYNKAIQEAEENVIKNYAEKDSLLNYIFSPYGFAFSKIKENNKTSKKVKENSIVNYTKTVYNLNNQLIYNETKSIIKIGKTDEIKGIEEGLKLMKEDEEFKFIFSSFVAHGFSGDSKKIGPNTPIIVNIKLLKINK